MSEEDHEERANYHLKRAHELWGELDPKNPDRMALESVTWHFAAANIHSRLAMHDAVEGLTESMESVDFFLKVDTTRLERSIEGLGKL